VHIVEVDGEEGHKNELKCEIRALENKQLQNKCHIAAHDKTM